MGDKYIFSKKKSKKGVRIAILGGTGVLIASLYVLGSSCKNQKQKKLLLDEDISVIGSITLEKKETRAITSQKTFITTTTKKLEVLDLNEDSTSISTIYDIVEEPTIIDTQSTTETSIVTIVSEEKKLNLTYNINDADTTQMVETSASTTTKNMDTTKEIVTSSVTEKMADTTKAPVTTKETSKVTIKIVTSRETSKETTSVLDSANPAIIKVTAEDVVNMANELVKKLNKQIVFKCENYKYSKLEAKDLYFVVFLANIDYISGDELQKLIDKGIISDNIEVNVANSFYFFELYANDTINKIMKDNTNIVDLSIFMQDQRSKETCNVMNNIIKGFTSNKKKQNRKNYLDTVFFYVENITLKDNKYYFSKSIYPTDRDTISVGANYVLSYAASCIDELAKMAGVSKKEYSKMMYDSRVDFSDVVIVFNNCCGKKDKVLVKN